MIRRNDQKDMVFRDFDTLTAVSEIPCGKNEITFAVEQQLPEIGPVVKYHRLKFYFISRIILSEI